MALAEAPSTFIARQGLAKSIFDELRVLLDYVRGEERDGFFLHGWNRGL